MEINKIGILYHPMVEATRLKAEEVNRFLKSRGLETWTCSAWETEQAIASLDGTDLILTTGGDGTILRASQVAMEHEIPIAGINMGTLGFMTEFKAAEVLDQLPELLAGGGWLDERVMLEAHVTSPEPDSNPCGAFYALNDVVLARGAIARLIRIDASVDDKPLTVYRADGVILATATGSTGYSLAAGGPILYPQSPDLLLVPIVSHLGMDYSLVLPSSSTIRLELVTSTQATLSIDGHMNIPVTTGTIITVRCSSRKTRFLRLHQQNYFFNVLEEKLRGKNN